MIMPDDRFPPRPLGPDCRKQGSGIDFEAAHRILGDIFRRRRRFDPPDLAKQETAYLGLPKFRAMVEYPLFCGP